MITRTRVKNVVAAVCCAGLSILSGGLAAEAVDVGQNADPFIKGTSFMAMMFVGVLALLFLTAALVLLAAAVDDAEVL